MKKTKKLLALVLALMMALSCMAMPAMAHGEKDEGIMPYGALINCDRCGAVVTVDMSKRDVVRTVDSCDIVPASHIHDVTIYYYFYDCAACGHRVRNVEEVHSCRGGQ